MAYARRFHMHNRFILCLLTGIVILVLVCLARPWVVVFGNGYWLLDRPAGQDTRVTIHFIHSVQKTPIWEYLQVNEENDGFVLNGTKYQSFGVGLPFLATDGVFHQEGDYFIMDHMDRHFPELNLRTGVGTRLTVALDDRLCPLYDMLPPGSKVDIVVQPLYRCLLTAVKERF